jgi:hypothetical protein
MTTTHTGTRSEAVGRALFDALTATDADALQTLKQATDAFRRLASVRPGLANFPPIVREMFDAVDAAVAFFDALDEADAAEEPRICRDCGRTIDTRGSCDCVCPREED